jgi:hypothetical protein
VIAVRSLKLRDPTPLFPPDDVGSFVGCREMRQPQRRHRRYAQTRHDASGLEQATCLRLFLVRHARGCRSLSGWRLNPRVQDYGAGRNDQGRYAEARIAEELHKRENARPPT